jgi:phage regulator Rha-like protein
LFEFVRDGNYSLGNIENEGSYEYRRNIYHNIREGINYIYEDYFKDRVEIIKPLTKEQQEILKDISKNKWFRIGISVRDDETINENIQVKLIKELGIKVYFDDKNKPYVLSHELAEIIQVEPKHIREKIRKLNKFMDGRDFDYPIKHSNFNTLDDEYINSQNKKQVTSRLYKDMLIFYLMDLTAQGNKKNDLLEFKMRYIDAFNYIEEEYKRLLEENAKLKESFLNMYNQIRKRNRELLIVEHNKKFKKVS